ncbi:MAG: hypothetical protein L6V78_07470 [Clostridium sp.]|nr:MAG: hypothetical protein L6V78_07470 [Clostridium sp.]
MIIYLEKELQRGCVNIKIDSSEDITTGLIEGIFNLYDNYENGYTRNIYFCEVDINGSRFLF